MHGEGYQESELCRFLPYAAMPRGLPFYLFLLLSWQRCSLFDFDASMTKDGIPKLKPKWRLNDHEQAVLSTCSSLVTVCSCMRLSG